MIVLREMFYKT